MGGNTSRERIKNTISTELSTKINVDWTERISEFKLRLANS